MEDSGLFDAGRGAYYTKEGVPENGRGHHERPHAGSGIRRLGEAHRKSHSLGAAGHGEDAACSAGCRRRRGVSPNRKESSWSRHIASTRSVKWKRFQDAQNDKTAGSGHGTVGVVALDQAGNLAAGTFHWRNGSENARAAWAIHRSLAPAPTRTTIAARSPPPARANISCATSWPSDICARVRYLHVSLDQAADDVVMKELVAQHGDAA